MDAGHKTVKTPSRLQRRDEDENSLNEFFTSTSTQSQGTEPRHIQQKKRKKRGFFSLLLQIIGELLLTVGIFLGLFVLWTIWWTNVTSGQVLDQEAVQIQKDFGEEPPVKPASAQEGAPPKVEPVGTGEAFAIMHIPAFGKDNQTPIKEGVDKWILDQGVFSHYKETAMPGDIGNFATAAHRDIYGARMRDVDKLEPGMPVVVETKDTFLIYKIIGSEIVNPTDVYTISPDPFIAKQSWAQDGTLPLIEPTRRLLTLTTCDPIMVASHRYIVYAEFEYWTKRADGLPKELLTESVAEDADSTDATLSGLEFDSNVLAFGGRNLELQRYFSLTRAASWEEN